MSDDDILAGIAAASAIEDDMPRVVATFEHPGVGTVSIVEPVIGSDDGPRRGYLWVAVAGEFILSPTHRGLADPERWVPGKAELLPGARILAYSSTSAKQAITNARRALRKERTTDGTRQGA